MDGVLSDGLPIDFSYPETFLRAAKSGLLNLDPWWALNEALIKARSEQLAERFPQLRLLPFSRRQDNDDVACWNMDDSTILIIDPFGIPGTEKVEIFSSIDEWLRRSLDDFLTYDE
ncbi:hypothetical protein ACFY0G_21795 [Streptomyces sp. NPDC001552]|uniref:hypothetical protein n=1 Tax=Streptomyces sp. NPDC001552 TaxID=3364587 RepID=UPI0036749AFD